MLRCPLPLPLAERRVRASYLDLTQFRYAQRPQGPLELGRLPSLIGTIPAGVLDDADDRGGISGPSETCCQVRRPQEPHPRQRDMLRFQLTVVICKFDGRPQLF